MENMINIAEILKDCPKGMELDSPNYNGVVKFEGVTQSNMYPIKISITHNNMIFTNTLTKYGQTYISQYHKCVIFPKGKTTWEGFQKPFKDGDILFIESFCSWILIYKESKNEEYIYKYVAVSPDTSDFLMFTNDHAPSCRKESISEIRFATEGEKQKLFDVIKANGYHWNDETKTLEKNKFDITTLKPFDKVLVRDENGQKWMCDIFSYYDDKNPRYPFWGVGRSNSKQCIPYKDNEHLLGTTNDCDEFYKNWK